VDVAFKLRRKVVPFQIRDDELPLIMATAGGSRSNPNRKGISIG
jgi:hypothetical protein